MNKSIKDDLKTRLIGKIDDNCLSIVMVQLTQLLNEYETAEEGLGVDSDNLLQSFLSSKRLEGCSDRTLTYYETTIDMMLKKVSLPVVKIDTDDIRQYLSEYQSDRGSSKVTIDNIRRIFSSFFSWLEDEEYILKSPVRRIHKVKFGRTVKDTFSDEDLEKMRDGCDNIRNLSIIDTLSSTGIRVGELVRLNRSDIDFNERECIVFGKGESERKVYFDARTKLHLQEYLKQRSDDNPALFVTLHNPIRRISINGVETMLKNLETITSIENIHPHKFRRTMATRAIDKGMPIEQVQKILGHVRIDTTLHYAMVNQENVKNAHKKYVA
ncbi:MAG: tyrosine-type recombinase/integrase [Gudongella sp.]|nr:tyrosine-type recombinase/integrase [Gudongella sp.]